MTYII